MTSDDNGMMEGGVILLEQYEELAQAADDGDELARLAVVGIGAWVTDALESATCVECNAAFNEELGAFAVAIKRQQHSVVVGGICRECVAHTDRDERRLLEIAKRTWRSTLWPDLAEVNEVGHA